MRKFTTILAFLLLSVNLTFGQNVKDQIKSNPQRFNVSTETVDNWVESSHHFSKNNKIGYYYYQTQINDIDVLNHIYTVVTKDGKVLKVNSPSKKLDYNKIINKAQKTVQLSSDSAVKKAFNDIGIKSVTLTGAPSERTDGTLRFKKNRHTLEDITAKKVYLIDNDGSLKLTWKVFIYTKDGHHAYEVYIDTNNGKVLKKDDAVVHCNFGDHTTHDHKHRISPINFSKQARSNAKSLNTAATASYNVFDLYTESPNHGERTIVTDPWTRVGQINDLEDQGWHSDGTNSYTSTRGNNVDAYVDWNGDDLPTNGNDDRAVAEDLNFDFPFDDSKPQSENKDASVTNLFFWSNITHDVLYKYGFDEAAGNFQKNNFNKGGKEVDQVLAQAQDGGGTDNANFAALPDGNYGRMQMYNWTSPQALAVNSPATVAGNYAMKESNFSTANKLESVGPVTGNIVLALDTENNTSEACNENPIANTADLAGKIAVIYRGSCSFTDKVQNAQNAGAIGVLVINNKEGDPIVMGGENNAVTIPAVMVSQADGAKILAELESGDVEITMDATNTNFYPDGDFDNGIIVHEYGHGLSIRLTGGADNTACLRNQEQMGEGWSDFVGLMLITDWSKAKESDVRGIGTYPSNQGTDGSGIRRYPYSTDFTVNPFTYGDIADEAQIVPHGVGSVWGTMLWDMMWEIAKEEPLSADIYSTEGANGIALSLVVEGLKLQPCSPGFVDGRDAILLADEMLYDGKYKCAIWKAFARRGLGKSASQGDSNDKTDGVEAFDLPAECVVIDCDKVTLEKTASKDIAVEGDIIEYTLKVTNDCPGENTVTIVDALPEGLEFIEGEAASFENGVISYTDVVLNPASTTEFTFTAKVLETTKTGKPASTHLSQNVDGSTEEWSFKDLKGGTDNWIITDTKSNSPTNSFYSTPQDTNSFSAVISPFVQLPTEGKSVLKFTHFYDLDGSETSGYDLGFVEVSLDGSTWYDLGSYFEENGYNSKGSILTDYYNRAAFSAQSGDFITSKIDLSELAGLNVQFRWAIATDNYATLNGDGWYVDDIIVETEAVNGIDQITNKAILTIQTLLISSDEATTQLGTDTDIEAPTTPLNVTSSNIDVYSLDLSWDASTDNIEVKEYKVFQDDVLIATVTEPFLSIDGLDELTSYNFTVKAIDVNNLESELSEVHTVSTIENPDKEAPSVPLNVSAANTTSDATDLSWSDSTDDVGVTGYNVYQDGVLIDTVVEPNISITGLEPGTDYTFTVTAIDKAGNESEKSEELIVSTTAAEPTTVTIVTDIFGSETEWTVKDKDNNIVMSGGGYAGNKTYVSTSNLPYGCYTFEITDSYGDGQGSTGTYEVKVNDTVVASGGGDFGDSETKEFCINDEIAPTEPVRLQITAAEATSITINWEDSEDNVLVTAYNVYLDGVLVATYERTTNFVAGSITTTHTEENLKPNTDYTFEVEAVDDAGNTSTKASIAQTTALPVTFKDFNVSQEEYTLVLDWSTSTEYNNKGFEVQKSIDGKNFETIGFVEGNGTTTNDSNYEFIDNNADADIIYYRLKQVDYDSAFAYSTIISIVIESKTAEVYPNPASEFITISNVRNGASFNIIDTNGRLVKEGKVTKQISISSLNPGQYIIQIKENNNMISHREVIIVQ